MRPVDAVSVPVIDLAPARAAAADRLRVAAAIDAACREIGFFAIDGHGVPARVVDELRAVAHAFFAMPREDKLAARHPVAGTNRGYHPVGGEALSSANDEPAPPDLKEFFHVGPVDVGSDAYYTSAEGCRHFTPNVWPAAPPDFERAATVYYRAMSELVRSLMRLAALALSVDETFFDDKVDRSVGTMRLNYYPAQARLPTPGQLRAGAHTDYGGFTILSGEDVPRVLQPSELRRDDRVSRVAGPRPAPAGALRRLSRPQVRQDGIRRGARAYLRSRRSRCSTGAWTAPRWTPPTTTAPPSGRRSATATSRTARRAARRFARVTADGSTCPTAPARGSAWTFTRAARRARRPSPSFMAGTGRRTTRSRSPTSASRCCPPASTSSSWNTRWRPPPGSTRSWPRCARRSRGRSTTSGRSAAIPRACSWPATRRAGT